MKGKILFVTGGLVGYVLGARAGRKRYEQIRSAVSKVWEKPAIQNQVHQAQDFAADKAAEVPDVLIGGATKLVSSLIKRARSDTKAGSKAGSNGNRSGSTSGTPSGATSGNRSSGNSGAAPSATGTSTGAGIHAGDDPVVVKTTDRRASTSTPEDDA